LRWTRDLTHEDGQEGQEQEGGEDEQRPRLAAVVRDGLGVDVELEVLVGRLGSGRGHAESDFGAVGCGTDDQMTCHWPPRYTFSTRTHLPPRVYSSVKRSPSFGSGSDW
jgi:hypothetical protein